MNIRRFLLGGCLATAVYWLWPATSQEDPNPSHGKEPPAASPAPTAAMPAAPSPPAAPNLTPAPDQLAGTQAPPMADPPSKVTLHYPPSPANAREQVLAAVRSVGGAVPGRPASTITVNLDAPDLEILPPVGEYSLSSPTAASVRDGHLENAQLNDLGYYYWVKQAGQAVVYVRLKTDPATSNGVIAAHGLAAESTINLVSSLDELNAQLRGHAGSYEVRYLFIVAGRNTRTQRYRVFWLKSDGAQPDLIFPLDAEINRFTAQSFSASPRKLYTLEDFLKTYQPPVR